METEFRNIFSGLTVGDKIKVNKISFKTIKNAEIIGIDNLNKFVYLKMGKKSLNFIQDFPVVIRDFIFLAKSTDPKYKITKFQFLCKYSEFDSYVKKSGGEQ